MFDSVTNLIKTIEPGQHVRHPVHEIPAIDGNDFDWDMVEELQMMVRGNGVPNDILVTLRFEAVVFVDIYRFSMTDS